MLSNAPRRKRRTINEAKLDAAPWQASTIDQQKMVPERYLPIGILTKPMEAGKLAMR